MTSDCYPCADARQLSRTYRLKREVQRFGVTARTDLRRLRVLPSGPVRVSRSTISGIRFIPGLLMRCREKLGDLSCNQIWRSRVPFMPLPLEHGGSRIGHCALQRPCCKARMMLCFASCEQERRHR